nr:hypothetical protein RKYZRHPG_RKYZRHPG_CDS_0005 [uncultured phage]
MLTYVFVIIKHVFLKSKLEVLGGVFTAIVDIVVTDRESTVM